MNSITETTKRQKVPKELRVPYPKALKDAEQAAADAERTYYAHQPEIDRLKEKIAGLSEELEQLDSTINERTAEDDLSEEQSRTLFAEKGFIEHEIKRHTAVLSEMDTKEVRNEKATAMQQTKRAWREGWERYWLDVQAKAADHIVENVGMHVGEALSAYQLATGGDAEDWLLDQLLPRVRGLTWTCEHPVSREQPITPRDRAAEEEAHAHAAELERELDEEHQKAQQVSRFERARRKWMSVPNRIRAGTKPILEDFS